MISRFLRSSLIDSVSYDQFKLLVRFKSGSAYIYYGVPYSVFEDLTNSKSPGQYYNTHIKGKYKQSKVQTYS